jgi:hypothetical protein
MSPRVRSGPDRFAHDDHHMHIGYAAAMESKTARLTVLVDPEKKKAFETLCAQQDLTPSQVIRQLMREYLAKHGVSYRTQAPRSRTTR